MKNLKTILLLLFICGVFGDEVKTVMEGDSVTLDSDLTEIQNYWQISWRFEDNLIADISEGNLSYRPGPDGSFRDRLQLDSETASLTITNMRTKHSGVYKLEAISSSSPSISKKFTVSVYESPSAVTVVEAELVSDSVTAGESLTLHTQVLQPRDELIVWRFGNQGKLIAKADLETKKNSLYDTDERFRDRLKLNNQDGSLTINNMRNTDSGLYLVKISSSKQTLHKKFIVTVTDPGLSSGVKAGIVVAVVVLLVILAAAAGVFYCRWKKSEEKRKNLKISERWLEISETRNQLPEISERWLKISETLNQLPEITKELKHLSEIADQYSEGGKKTVPSKKPDQSADIYVKVKHQSGDYEELEKLSVEVSVKEGETVILEIGVEDWKNVQIFCKFELKNSLKAESKEGADVITHDDPIGRFKGRLELDKETGNLSINKTNTGDSGKYNVWIRSSNKNTFLIFTLSVSGSAGKVTGKKLIELKADSTENGASESSTVEMRLLSEDQQGSV